MKHTIDTLVSQFERGSLTRRQLVQALLLVAASPVLAQESPVGAFRPTGIDHVQITVTDLKATQQFYERLFGVHDHLSQSNAIESWTRVGGQFDQRP